MRKKRIEKTTGHRRNRTRAEAEVVVAEYWQSAITQREFAAQAGIALSTLQYWLRRTRQRRPAAQSDQRNASSRQPATPIPLLEVELAPGPGRKSGRVGEPYEIVWNSGLRLRLGAEFDDGAVRRLMALLSETERLC